MKIRKIRSKEETSIIMSHIPGKNTKPELLLASSIFRLGIRYRKQLKVIGRPDLGIKKYRIAIFVDGDFWHGRKYLGLSKRQIAYHVGKYGKYWVEKIYSNIKRDEYINSELKKMKWKVFRFWETDINHNANKCAIKVKKYLDKQKAKSPNKDFNLSIRPGT